MTRFYNKRLTKKKIQQADEIKQRTLEKTGVQITDPITITEESKDNSKFINEQDGLEVDNINLNLLKKHSEHVANDFKDNGSE